MHDAFDDIRDATRKALAGVVTPDALKAQDRLAPELEARVWQVATDAGWPALLVPEEDGGLGLGMAAAAVVAEELGRAVAPGPWAAALCLAPWLVADPELRAGMAAGEVRAALALAEPDGEGTVALVDHAGGATHFLLIRPGAAGPEVSFVPAEAVIILTDHQPLDPGTPVARVRFAAMAPGVPVDPRALDAFRVFVAAELVGVARGAFARAVDYGRTRIQFKVPIGSFQGIKHRLADIAALSDAAALAVAHAAASLDTGDEAVAVDCQAAFDLAARAALEATAAAIQVHGAIGVSWEHDLHLYFKRARARVALMRHRLIPRTDLVAVLVDVMRLTAA